MALWDFRRESTATAAGANTLAGIAAGYQAPFVAGSDSTGGGISAFNKRNVIATAAGWVYRVHKTDMNSNARVQDQIIVAANPGSGLQYTSNTHLGKSDIAQIYVRLNANGYIGANTTGANLYVVFNTPLHFKASGNQVTISLSNTIGGNAAVGNFANNATQSRIVSANNTLVFRLPKLQGGVGSAKATYRINAQTLTVTGMPLYNPDEGNTTKSSANLVMTGAVSNNLMNGIGTRISTFQVARPAGQT